ncbi:MAG: sortase [Lachnospiraceae bacterium]|nr:sortase [Lachnospiraceae bacterium]
MRRRSSGVSTGMLIILVVIAALMCIALGVVMYMDKHDMLGSGTDASDVMGQSYEWEEDTDGDEEGSVIEEVLSTDVSSTASEGSAIDPVTGERTEVLTEPVPDKDVDIDKIKNSDNPDIYAWLYIPDTGIDEPILQHESDIAYYVTHNSEGKEDERGAVFTQTFNTKSFQDNLTVIYGNSNPDDAPFHNLNLYADPGFFNTHPYIYVYTDDEVLIYETFAAYESDDKLLVLFYGTNVYEQYCIYLNMIKDNIGMNGNLNEDKHPIGSDKVLTLSTRVAGKDDRRFLVQARMCGREPR